jgi:hypothetical protein
MYGSKRKIRRKKRKKEKKKIRKRRSREFVGALERVLA